MNDFFERVMEAQREALKNQIAANTILINEKLAKVKPFIFGNSLIPAMICGLEVKVTNELPDNVSFVVVEAAQTEREKLIAKIRTETAKEFLEELLGHFGNRQSELKKYPYDSKEETRGSYNENSKNIELIKSCFQKYGVVVDDE